LTDFILDKQMIWKIESLDTITDMSILQKHTNRGKLFFSKDLRQEPNQ
jgi:hypothetical protein